MTDARAEHAAAEGAAPRPREGDPGRRYRFGQAMRLKKRTEFERVYAGRRRVAAGPLLVFGLPGATPTSRLGLSVPRRVGNAVRRNRVKRLLREAFRHLRGDLPVPLDLVVNVRPHEPLGLAEYQRLLQKAATTLVRRLGTAGAGGNEGSSGSAGPAAAAEPQPGPEPEA